jgi:CelD/BcsL family acetyltransferase involved in cellulose biosynthesis
VSKVRNILGALAGSASNLFQGDRNLTRRNAPPSFEPLSGEGLTATCHTAWPADDDELARQWDALCDASASATGFHRLIWQRSAWKIAAAQAPLRLVAVHRGNVLLAVLPLVLTDQGALQTPGVAVSDYLDPLIARGCEALACRMMLRLLRGLWDRHLVELAFCNVRASAPARGALLAEAADAGFVAVETLVENAPVLALPRSWDEFLDSLSAHARKELRRKLNKATGPGEARFSSARDDGDATAALARAIGLMASRGGEKGAAVQRTLAPLLIATAPAMIQRGQLELLTLNIKEKAAACLLQFPSSTGPMLYNCGVDYSMKEWSPGVVAVAMAIQRAMSEGCSSYDMLRGQEAYKYEFGAKDRGIYRVVIKSK